MKNLVTIYCMILLNAARFVIFNKILNYGILGIFILVLATVFNSNFIYAQIAVPQNIDFGNVEVNDSLSTTVTVSNIGTENVTIIDITDPGAPFSLSNLPILPVVIAPADSEFFDVIFTPSDTGVFNATFIITSDDVGNPTSNVALSGIGFALNQADSGACYASTGSLDGGRLLKVDPSTGEGTLIGITGLNAVPGLAINSAGKIYCTDDQGNLYRIDAVTGEAIFISNPPGIGSLTGIAFDNNDTLYVTTRYYRRLFIQNLLYSVDPNSGASNLIGETGVSLNGLSFNPTSGILWGSDYYNSIYMIDKSTAMSTLVGHINLDHETTDLHFDIAGNLYATVGGDNEETSYFVSIDKTTGEGSIIGEIGFQSVSGLAFYNVPIEGKHISVVPSSINFGLIEVDDNRSTTITISNIGTENLTITDITDPGVPFGLDSLPILPVVITSGNSEYFYITFSPTESGDFNNSFTISSDDENNPALEISLSGTAIILNPADSGACYASTSKADSSSLIRIDPATGAGSLIGNTGLDYMQSLAINSQGKILGSDNSGKIFGIDAVTGGAVFISNPQLGRLRAMAFDDNDSLYVMRDQNLYIVDLASGTSSYISNTNLSATGLSFNPTDGTLWASESDAIYTIDATTGMTTLIGNTNLEYETTGLHLDIAGNLYATVEEYDETNNYLAFIDKASGEAEIIGEIGLLSVSGLAFYNVPIAGKHIRVIQSIVYLGQAEIGDSSAKSINLSNIGTDDLTVSSISSPGDPFGLSDIPSLPLVISSGHSESFKVTFTAPDSGMFNSTVTIFSDDDDDPTLDLYISAEGIFIAPAEPGGCYALAVNNNNRINGRLFRIDPATGEAILLGLTGLEAYQMDIAINTGGKIYGLDHEGILYRIDAMTGKAWFGLATNIENPAGIAFDNNDVLHAAYYPMYTSGLNFCTINLKTGTISVIANFTEIGFDGLLFDPTDNKWWGFASNNWGAHYIFKLESTNNMTNVANIPHTSAEIYDMQFDIAGNLYAAVGKGNINYFVSIDKTKMTSTTVRELGDFLISGLAFHNVPMPGKQIRNTPPHIDFRFVEVGDSSSMSIKISNVGSDNLTVSSISDPGNPFILNDLPSLPVMIPSGNRETFEVTFTAPSTGIFNKTITISSDDVDDPNLDVSLHAEGFIFALADSGLLYASTDRNQLLRINPSTGEGTIIGSTGTHELSGMAINSNGKIYGSDWEGSLFRVDAVTGNAIFLSHPGFGSIPGIAFDKSNELYATPNYDGLYKVDPTSGASNFIALEGASGAYFKGLSFNPADGILWASDGLTIFTINTSTRTQTLVGEINLGYYYRAHGLAFDAAGNLFATIVDIDSDNVSYFATINKTSGEGSIIGDIGFQSVGGLAFHPKTTVTDVAESNNILPEVFALKQNYPNPFNPVTIINYSLPIKSQVELVIYNTLGEKVKQLVNGEKEAGNYSVKLNSTGLSSGVYFYRIQAGDFVETKKMVLLR